MNILIVDDDRNICELVRLYLQKEGYSPIVAHDGREAIEKFHITAPGLIVLDLMLPVMDGIEVCKEIRKTSKVPIIMLTAKGETFDKVLGLELGADDYIVKPFEPKELVARVKAVLRRFNETKTEHRSSEIDLGELRISYDNYEVYLDGKQIEMPPKEFELLYFLASNKNKVFTRDQLLDEVWGYEFFGDSRTVDVHIKRVREKIEVENQESVRSWSIKTVWGVGYKFSVS